jgi:hypothetical protein
MRAIEGDGFGAKVRAWNDTARLEAWRASWADHVNRALAAAGESVRVDHRSLEAQGIDRLAQIQIGPAVIEMEARGITTDRGELARKIEAINAALAGSDSVLAQWPAPAMPAAEPPRTLERDENAEALTPPPEPTGDRLYQRDDTAQPATSPEMREPPERGIPTYRLPSENAPAATATRPIVAAEPETAKTSEHAARRFGGGRTAGRAAAIIKGLFREAKAMLRRADVTPQPKQRKRTGETEGDFRKLARQIVRAVSKVGATARGRYAALREAKPVQATTARESTISVPAEFFYADPGWNVFDIANPLHDHGDSFDDSSNFDSAFDARSEHLSPGF